ncbi:MAG: hypothetical protein WDN06_00450 [Asticcacaulis sp.]
MEDDPTLFEVNGRYNNNYFNEMSLLHLARDNGYQDGGDRQGRPGPAAGHRRHERPVDDHHRRRHLGAQEKTISACR